MLSPSKFGRSKFETIIGDRGDGLLRPKRYDVVQRGANNSPAPKKDNSPKVKTPKDGVAAEEDGDEFGKPKTKTMNCGMIKFEDIVIPPSAPTDLICEECEVAISVLSCSRCRQVFCMKCAESCHPRPYGEEYHPHEVDGHLRAVQFGDKSRIKINNDFVLPAEALHEEEYLKIKDLSKPQSLSTSLVHAKPAKDVYSAPKYDVHQVVLFTDPHTEQEAYGTVISQWDQRHGTMATPAILRGEGSIVFYMVQLLGYSKNVVNIATLIPHVSTVSKIDNHAVIEGVEVDAMMEYRKRAHVIHKRIAEAEGIKRLGPKHHLRDVVNYGVEKDVILLESREYGLNSSRPKYTGDQLLNSAVYNSNIDDMSECVTVATSTVSQRHLVANKHRKLRLGTSNEYIIAPLEFPDDLYSNVDLNMYADVDTDVHSQLSFDNPLAHPFPAYHRSYQHVLHSHNVDSNMSINSSSQQSEGSTSTSPHKEKARNMDAALRSAAQRTGKYINSGHDKHNIYQSDDHRMRDSVASGDSAGYGSHASALHSQHHSQSAMTAAAAKVDDYTRKALQVLVLRESELCTVQERMASEVQRKNALLRHVWDKLCGSEKLQMKQHGFSRWEHHVGILRDNVQYKAAVRIQSLCRKYLCRDKLAEKTGEFIARVRQKWVNLHAQFRYSDASDHRAVTMNDKIYFETHLDLNRYAALMRVLVFKLAKYLARKRTALLKKAVNKWRGGMTTFLESDIQSTHFNELAIDFEPAAAKEQFVSLEHQRAKITAQHLALHDLASGVVLTSPLRTFPKALTDELAHDTILEMPLRLPDIPQLNDMPPLDHKFDQMMSFTHLSKPNTPAAGSRGGGSRSASRGGTGSFSPGRSSEARPLTGVDKMASFAESSAFGAEESSVLVTDVGTPSGPVFMDLSHLMGDLVSGSEVPKDPPPSHLTSKSHSARAATGNISNASMEFYPAPHELVPSYYPAQDIELPPLPRIHIPRTAEERLHLKNERRLDYCEFRAGMVGPTFDSNWVIKDRLCMGSMPWGAAEESNTEYPTFPEFTSGMGMSMKSSKVGASIKIESSASMKVMNSSTGISADVLAAKNKFKHEKWKAPPVTSISALLLNKIDLFVSLLDEEEEDAIEQACRVPSVRSCIQDALRTANAAVSSIISHSTEIISKQTKQLDDIPRYGKSDPRFPAAYREMLRCKARIQLANDNITKARQQIKNLPPFAEFVRIPLRIDGLNTINEILPKIWQLESLLQAGRNMYIYSRDGHGRAALVSGILLGRLYSLHPYEALYRLQASHDSAKRDAKRDIPINCPQLPVQRELLTQVLNLTNRPQELAFVRTQIDPEIFVEHLPQRPLLHDATVHTSYSRSTSNASDGGVYRPPHAHPRGVTMVHGLVAVPQGSLPSASDAGSVGSSSTHKGRGKMSRALSWQSYQAAEAAAAAEAEEAARNAHLGNNMEVIEAEKEFLDALFAAQNQRRKQTFGMKTDSAYTWSAASGITHRSGAVGAGGAAGAASDASAKHTDGSDARRRELPPEPLLPDLYDRTSLGQSVDVARKLPVKRPEPTQRPHLPHIRTATVPTPAVPLAHSSTYNPL